MKKLLLSLVCVLGLLGGLRAQEETISIGSGNSSSYRTPINTDQPYSVSQQIYSADEIGKGAGKISKIAFRWVTASTETRNLSVYMQNTTQSSFGGWIPLTDNDKVFDGEVNINSEWVEITFTTKFDYTGGNLLLCVYDKTGIWGLKSNFYNYTTSSTTISAQGGNPYDLSNMSGGTVRNFNNQIKLTFTVAGAEEIKPAAPTNLKAEALSDSQILLTWDAVENALTYNVYQNDVMIAEDLAVTNYTIENLNAVTNYCFTVTAVNDLESDKSAEACGETEATPSAATTFAFDFNDGTKGDMRVFQGATASHLCTNWGTPQDHSTVDLVINQLKTRYKGVDGSIAVYSLTYDVLEDVTRIPDNYIVTNKSYLITATSTIEWDIRQAEDGKADQYSIVVSEDGTNFTDIWFEIYGDKTGETKAYSLADYEGKELYIGFHHYKQTDGGALCLDNVKLVTDSQLTPEEPIDPTAPTVPDNVNAVAFSESSIKLTWNAAENTTSYTIYNGDDIVATSVTETSYMIEGLDANTTYCFTVTAVNEEVSSTTEDPYNGYEYVDLGLPSGLKWATCNIGASEPEECGNYYAWGETITKNQYNEQTSLVWGKRLDDISGNPQYDAASANWGGKWRMPTKDEMEELLTECNWEQTTMNDVVGYKFASKTNDNYIFLPSAGMYSDTNIASVGETLFYWSSTSEWEDLAGYARTYLLNDFLSMMFGPIHVSQIIMGHTGLSVRPVSGGNFVYGKESAKSSEVCATTFEATPEAPAAPTNLKAEAVTDATINLTWDAVEGADVYYVYQGIIKLVTVAEPTHLVTGLQAGKEYCFTVTAVNDGGESAKSEQACATTLVEEGYEKPAAPQHLTVVALVPGELTLMWDAVEGAEEYNVYGEEGLIGTLKQTSVDIKDLEANTQYCFTVTAIIEGVESEPSNEACETTLPGEGIVELTSSINVYPNPVNDKLFIETETVVEEVVVYDVFGRHQVTETPSHQGDLSIDVADLNSGVYFVKVVTENGEAVQRFIKK